MHIVLPAWFHKRHPSCDLKKPWKGNRCWGVREIGWNPQKAMFVIVLSLHLSCWQSTFSDKAKQHKNGFAQKAINGGHPDKIDTDKWRSMFSFVWVEAMCTEARKTFFARRAYHSCEFSGCMIFRCCLFCGGFLHVFSKSCFIQAAVEFDGLGVGVVGHFLTLQCN